MTDLASIVLPTPILTKKKKKEKKAENKQHPSDLLLHTAKVKYSS